jgi:DNA (cytosine-5)-methyltransferase 1
VNALYNEIEPFAADWLESLITAEHIAPGRVERRSITELTAADVGGTGQRHFFAGIGGWSYALRLAGVADDADIWTGSCPCQPFSQAGRRGGTDDPRHLWPAWFRLIRECRPSTIFGEQVAGTDGLAWLDDVLADLEGCGYACGASVVSAGGASAPHARHRIYFVAHADDRSIGERLHVLEGRPRQEVPDADWCGTDGTVADTVRSGRTERRTGAGHGSTARRGGDMGYTDGLAGGRHSGAVPRAQATHEGMRSGNHRPWSTGVELVVCADGKRRPIPTEPTLFPLANGVPNRVGLLRGSGNAIVPQVAAVFIQAAEQARKALT